MATEDEATCVHSFSMTVHRTVPSTKCSDSCHNYVFDVLRGASRLPPALSHLTPVKPCQACKDRPRRKPRPRETWMQ